MKNILFKVTHMKFRLKHRIFIMTLALVLFTALIFAVGSYMRFHGTILLFEDSNEAQRNVIMDTMSAQSEEIAKATFSHSIESASEIADSEFWSVAHDMELLACQVELILSDPDRFSEALLLPPSMADAGKLTPQLLFASYYDPADTQAMRKIYKLANLSGMVEEIMQKNKSIHDTIITLPEGVSIMTDNFSQSKFNADGTLSHFDAARRPWYAGALVNHGLHVSPLNTDTFDGSRQIEISIPVYIDEEFAAICASAVDMSRIEQIVEKSRPNDNTFTCLVGPRGNLIYSDIKTGELSMERGEYYNLRDSTNMELIAIVNAALNGGNGCELIHIDGKPMYAAYARLDTVGMAQLLVVSEESLQRGAVELLEKTDAIFKETQLTIALRLVRTQLIMSLFIPILILIAVFISLMQAERLSRPIRELNRAGLAFIERTKTDYKRAPVYFKDLNIHTGDEIEELWYTLQDMEINIAISMRRIKKMTSEKERIDAELSLASNIQANMLPKDFHPMDRHDASFSLYATMTPAKEVGGDFYDFFPMDDTHLALVIADVSGKGVPAAMFMMMSKFFINSYGSMGISPKDILENVNNALCQYNQDNMFVTVWIGILDITSGEVVAASAGHEYPAIRGADGRYALFHDPRGFVIGGFEGMNYENYTFTLKKGDSLFVYTDGVPEATDAKGELFGEERMIDALNASAASASPQEILADVKAAVDAFVGKAEQFDDLTMLCVRYQA